MPEKSQRRSSKSDRSFRRVSREARVNLAVEMSSVAMALTLDNIRDQHPGISRSKLMTMARRRLRPRHSVQQDIDDVKAILANTRVDMRRILVQAKKDGTLGILREILRTQRETGALKSKRDQ